MKYKVKATLTGYFYIDENDFGAYQAANIDEAIKNQLAWLEDEGEQVGFVADTISEDVELKLEVYTITS